MRFNELSLDQLKLFEPHPRAAISEAISLAAKPLSGSRNQQILTRVSNHPT